MSRTAALIGGSLVAAVVTTRAAAATARRLGVVDPPGPLKPQASAVPYLGGVGVLAGAAVGAASAQPLVLIPLSLATALGTADDCMDLSPSARLAGQIAIGIVGAMTVRTRLASPIGPVLVAGTSVLLTNGVNLIDGLDGLAGGVAAVASGAFALMLEGDARLVAGSLALGCIGFLTYNRPPAARLPRRRRLVSHRHLSGTAVGIGLAERRAARGRRSRLAARCGARGRGCLRRGTPTPIAPVRRGRGPGAPLRPPRREGIDANCSRHDVRVGRTGTRDRSCIEFEGKNRLGARRNGGSGCRGHAHRRGSVRNARSR